MKYLAYILYIEAVSKYTLSVSKWSNIVHAETYKS